MLPAILDDGVRLAATPADWREAVELAGAALVAAGAARPEYAGEMVRMIDEHGPYIVVAPGLALAHARPGPAVLADGLAVITLAEPVPFGHPYNDPVRVVLGVSAASNESHLKTVADLANVFNDTDAVDRLAAATSVDEVRAIFSEHG